MNPTDPLPDDLVLDAFGWDARNWSSALTLWDPLLPAPGFRALELGCARNGGLSLWLARRGGRVTSSFYRDVAPEMRAAHERHGVSGSIEYVPHVDALQLPYQEAFDVVVFKSMLGMIPGENRGTRAAELILDGVHRALKPGGWLFFAENLVGTPVHMAFRNRFGAGRVGWYYYTVGELRRALGSRFEVRDRTSGLVGCFGIGEGPRRLLGTLDRLCLERVVPRSWHYIYHAAARRLPAP